MAIEQINYYGLQVTQIIHVVIDPTEENQASVVDYRQLIPNIFRMFITCFIPMCSMFCFFRIISSILVKHGKLTKGKVLLVGNAYAKVCLNYNISNCKVWLVCMGECINIFNSVIYNIL